MSKATGYNWWKYSRYVYNVGRTSRQMAYSDNELAAIRSFITSILASRPEIAYKINLKNLNSSKTYANQNFMSTGLMLQVIGRNLKLYSLSTDEKSLCDSLFEITGERKNKRVLPYFTISGSVSPTSSGSISGTGSYGKNSKATLKAVPARGYAFSAWQDSATATQERKVEVTADATYTATFTAATARTITAGPATADTGTVAITGATSPYYDGDVLTLTPTAATGYHFVKWEDDSTTAVRTLTVSGDKTCTATFAADEE